MVQRGGPSLARAARAKVMGQASGLDAGVADDWRVRRTSTSPRGLLARHSCAAAAAGNGVFGGAGPSRGGLPRDGGLHRCSRIPGQSQTAAHGRPRQPRAPAWRLGVTISGRDLGEPSIGISSRKRCANIAQAIEYETVDSRRARRARICFTPSDPQFEMTSGRSRPAAEADAGDAQDGIDYASFFPRRTCSTRCFRRRTRTRIPESRTTMPPSALASTRQRRGRVAGHVCGGQKSG